jgi:hypothetical protein
MRYGIFMMTNTKTRAELLAMNNAEYAAYSDARMAEVWKDLRRDEMRYLIGSRLLGVALFAFLLLALASMVGQ